ncbi:osmotically inducible protein OsmC [Paraburkholderia sp. GAS38]|jgi:osmotically inducible protein OsmC
MKSGLRPRLSRCVARSTYADAARTWARPLRQASWSNAQQRRQGYPLERTMKRKASAVWQGGLQDGKGTISTDSGVLKDTQYSFATRFEDGIGTNPEELIAAAHAGCFSMALSAELGKVGIKPERIGTTATLTLDKADGGFAITAVHLDVKVKIPGGDRAAFEKATADAKAGCPVSKVLKATITMDATLET